MSNDILGDKNWHIHKGDCIPHMAEDLPESSMDMAVFSPPFPSLYAYTSESCDIGNTATVDAEASIHLSFFFKALARVVKPGRAIVVHVCQIPKMKRAGEVGLCDFRGLNIRIGERAGLIYEYDWLVRKNPQAQAIRTRARELQFAGLESDRAKQRGCLGDYLIKFRVPGENEVPIDTKGQVSRNEWIDWAESCWPDIQETDTLNTEQAKGPGDVKHICPLQLEVYRRCILLYSNPGEIVFEPFAGIGSGGFSALGGTSPKTGKRINDPRRYYGCEIKDEYFNAATKRLSSLVVNRAKERSLFDLSQPVVSEMCESVSNE